jgi:hypothetical protein
VVRNAEGLELNRVEYSVAGNANVSRSLDRNAELQLTLDRKDYEPGQEIEVSIRAPYVGAGLITIERDKVYAHQWFKTDKTASVQKITLPKDFEGTGYVNVHFVRDPASDEVYMSPLSYGVVPFATSLPRKRTANLQLTSAELVKPGQTVKMKLTSDKPTRAVVFAVDEGILQVARYKTPDPLKHFFQKRALEVGTLQTLDLILPEFKKLMQGAAPGGDGEGELGKHLNPFKRKRDKPVAYWSGLVDVNGSREFSYTVPESFNGSLRVMAVAINDETTAAKSTRTVVRGDMVILPNAPLAMAPGDTVEVGVGPCKQHRGLGQGSPHRAHAHRFGRARSGGRRHADAQGQRARRGQHQVQRARQAGRAGGAGFFRAGVHVDAQDLQRAPVDRSERAAGISVRHAGAGRQLPARGRVVEQGRPVPELPPERCGGVGRAVGFRDRPHAVPGGLPARLHRADHEPDLPGRAARAAAPSW